jgi:hypothetical protein
MVFHFDQHFLSAIFSLTDTNRGYLDHLERCAVLEQAVALQDKAVRVPVLPPVHSQSNGLTQLLKLKLVSAFLQI